MTVLAGGLSDRDVATLRLVGELKLVTGGQLRRLVFGDPSASSQNARIARRILNRLTEDRLLKRLVRRLGGFGGGSSSYIYALSPAGARACGLPPVRHREDPSLTYLHHTLAISETYTQLFEAKYAEQIQQLDVVVEPATWRDLGDGSGSLLKPDLFVELTTATEDVVAYIEIDLATEHVGAIRRKLALYAAHRATGRDVQRYGVTPLVVWSVPNLERLRQMERYLQPEANKNPGLHQVVVADQLITQLTKGGDHA